MIRKNYSILIVDDDFDFVSSIVRSLSRFGYNVTPVTSVTDALSVMNFEKPDIIITDSNMPDGGGRKLIEFIKFKSLGISVVVVSGVDNSQHSDLLNIGVTQVLVKPFDIEELVEILDRELGILVKEKSSHQPTVG